MMTHQVSPASKRPRVDAPRKASGKMCSLNVAAGGHPPAADMHRGFMASVASVADGGHPHAADMSPAYVADGSQPHAADTSPAHVADGGHTYQANGRQSQVADDGHRDDRTQQCQYPGQPQWAGAHKLSHEKALPGIPLGREAGAQPSANAWHGMTGKHLHASHTIEQGQHTQTDPQMADKTSQRRSGWHSPTRSVRKILSKLAGTCIDESMHCQAAISGIPGKPQPVWPYLWRRELISPAATWTKLCPPPPPPPLPFAPQHLLVTSVKASMVLDACFDANRCGKSQMTKHVKAPPHSMYETLASQMFCLTMQL